MNEEQAAEYIASLARGLQIIAQSAKFETTCYLLSMIMLDLAPVVAGQPSPDEQAPEPAATDGSHSVMQVMGSLT
ncbi:hypothetical protein [Xanthobacter tagetidis]|uniref:hypothetical protein n=1 Tax=Xanthobacter tagetidis TaxID=60216 RepID=UPI0011C3A7A7|nr:hypothetical protein [Xanthobacter tagetidis]MBB6308886.1 hypothetical protein [Xanthobacter tagetidis]